MAALPEGVPPGTVPTGLRVEQWGLLQWKSRWLTHDTQQRVKVYESNAEWDGTARPFFEADLSAPGACAIQDATRPARARLDAGGKLLHLRFESEEHCTRFVDAVTKPRTPPCAEAPARAVFDPAQYPESIGKYRVATDRLGNGGFGVAKKAVDTETGERLCCKMARPSKELGPAQVRCSSARVAL
jgi:hypothetical protein